MDVNDNVTQCMHEYFFDQIENRSVYLGSSLQTLTNATSLRFRKSVYIGHSHVRRQPFRR